MAHAFTAFAAPDAARGGFCDRPDHRAPGRDPGRRLETVEWRPWFDRARTEDLAWRAALQPEAPDDPVPEAGHGASHG
ncbi:hypothetical protein [Microbacterium sp. HSID17254]|uniref:hypothetical protein n=1 Tax=Microbacterium sp. HSID17254 TaxID=2419509 RepID=UPI0013866519|nr:hypothetical protein [Microbacterium sp. HSID17254]